MKVDCCNGLFIVKMIICVKIKLLPPQDSPEYDAVIHPCHQRAADRIVAGALQNGGLYIKLGQGLGSFNQVLPREYIDTLKTLQDMVRQSPPLVDLVHPS